MFIHVSQINFDKNHPAQDKRERGISINISHS
jgi:hypothetical protein